MTGAEKNSALLRALQHPTRRVILRQVDEHPGTSPSQIAVNLNMSISDIGYHCRVLRGCGAIELIRQKQVRGAIQNFYRFAIDDAWALEMLKQDGLETNSG